MGPRRRGQYREDDTSSLKLCELKRRISCTLPVPCRRLRRCSRLRLLGGRAVHGTADRAGPMGPRRRGQYREDDTSSLKLCELKRRISCTLPVPWSRSTLPR